MCWADCCRFTFPRLMEQLKQGEKPVPCTREPQSGQSWLGNTRSSVSERHKVLSAVLVTVAAGSLSNFAQTTLTHLATLRKAARPAQLALGVHTYRKVLKCGNKAHMMRMQRGLRPAKRLGESNGRNADMCGPAVHISHIPTRLHACGLWPSRRRSGRFAEEKLLGSNCCSTSLHDGCGGPCPSIAHSCRTLNAVHVRNIVRATHQLWIGS